MFYKICAAFAFFIMMSFLGCAALLEPPSDIQRSVDYLRQDIRKLAEEQKALSKKIDSLADGQSGESAEPAVKEPVPSTLLNVDDSANLSQDPGDLYNKAMNFMKNSKTEDAERAFADFIVKFPQSDLADNAQYWIGECFYSQKKFQEAREGFSAVQQHFPFGNKVPDAIYKEALCAGELGKIDERTALLKQLIENYPYSEASLKAESLLSQIEKNLAP
jgi:tol-pal system protein YbgF